jgi:hypothetical protein
MARLMCIATHHKGGTIWIKRSVMALSRAIGVKWHGIWSDKQMDRVPDSGRAFLCNWNGYFPKPLWDSDETAFLHVIRDPRDILLSGCAYHQHAGPKGEAFLHRKRKDLAGLTYQQHLNALETRQEKLLFEMENKHAETVAQMRAWPWGDPRIAELRYEDLIEDHACAGYAAALTGLGLAPGEVEQGRQAFWDNSLFGGASPATARPGHVASGAARRWERELPRRVGEFYAESFGADLIALGYETDFDWVARLPETAPA